MLTYPKICLEIHSNENEFRILKIKTASGKTVLAGDGIVVYLITQVFSTVDVYTIV